LATDSVSVAAKNDVTAKALLPVHPGGAINRFDELDHCRTDFLGKDDHDGARAIFAILATFLAGVGASDIQGSEGAWNLLADLRSGLYRIGMQRPGERQSHHEGDPRDGNDLLHDSYLLATTSVPGKHLAAVHIHGCTSKWP